MISHIFHNPLLCGPLPSHEPFLLFDKCCVFLDTAEDIDPNPLKHMSCSYCNDISWHYDCPDSIAGLQGHLFCKWFLSVWQLALVKVHSMAILTQVSFEENSCLTVGWSQMMLQAQVGGGKAARCELGLLRCPEQLPWEPALCCHGGRGWGGRAAGVGWGWCRELSAFGSSRRDWQAQASSLSCWWPAVAFAPHFRHNRTFSGLISAHHQEKQAGSFCWWGAHRPGWPALWLGEIPRTLR